MYIERTLIIPTDFDENASFYERTTPDCVYSNTEQAKKTTVPYGNYDSLTWTSESVPSVLEDATTWGTKSFPGVGPFYFANHEDGTPTIGQLPPANENQDNPQEPIIIIVSG